MVADMTDKLRPYLEDETQSGESQQVVAGFERQVKTVMIDWQGRWLPSVGAVHRAVPD